MLTVRGFDAISLYSFFSRTARSSWGIKTKLGKLYLSSESSARATWHMSSVDHACIKHRSWNTVLVYYRKEKYKPSEKKKKKKKKHTGQVRAGRGAGRDRKLLSERNETSPEPVAGNSPSRRAEFAILAHKMI